METLDFGLHDILIYEMKNGEGKGGKYLEKENTCFFRVKGKHLEKKKNQRRKKIFGKAKHCFSEE